MMITNHFDMPVRGWLAARLRRFRSDQRGSVTLQVIVFSILLLGTTGVVLDSGRLYSAHTQMQVYADRMALAAANELDGQPDAIDRAVDAVYNSSGSGAFLGAGKGESEFRVERIIFYSQMGTATGRPNDLSDSQAFLVATGDAGGAQYTAGREQDAAMAQYAAVIVAEGQIGSVYQSIGSVLVDLANSTSENLTRADAGSYDYSTGVQNGNISFQTMAVATLERQTCADMSTIVLCNPWETIVPEGSTTGEALGSRALDIEDPDYQNLPGRSLMVFAPNYASGQFPNTDPVAVSDGTAHGSLFAWAETNQVMRLTAPVADPGGVCSIGYLMDTQGNTVTSEAATNYLEYRDLCLMARARSETVCFEDTIEFSPATGPMLTRATSPIFDRWPEPFRSIIQNDMPVTNAGMTRAQFFEPDSMAATPFESADRHGATCPTDSSTGYSEQDGNSDMNNTGTCGMSDPFNPEYDTYPPGMTFMAGAYFRHYGQDFCHFYTYVNAAGGNTPHACENDFIGDYHRGIGGSDEAQMKHWFRYYWTRIYRDPNNLSAAPPALPTNVATWYDVYQEAKAQQANMQTNANLSRISMYSVENATRLGMATDEATRQQKYVKHNPVEYLAASGVPGVINAGYERRRIRSAMVNCKAAVDEAGIGATTFSAPIVQVVDWYMPEAAGVFCGPGVPNCDIDASIESRMFVELIDTVDDTNIQRFTAHLVR